MYDSSGNFVKEFNCINDCMRFINPNAKMVVTLEEQLNLVNELKDFNFHMKNYLI